MRIGMVLALCALLGGCASATRGWSEKISLQSSPEGAIAVVSSSDAPFTCVTPCVADVARQAEVSVRFTKEGYEPQDVALTKEVAATGAAGFAGNILIGGVVGMVVDGVSGAALDHKPNPVNVVLEPLPRIIQAPPRKPTRRKSSPTS